MTKIVYLDPGHGGHDPGAVNRAFPLEEADMALDVCRRAKKILDPFVSCRLTRSNDSFKTLAERPQLANAARADVFVSYHFNSSSSPTTALSYEGFTTRGQNKSDELCTAILKEHGKLFPQQKLRADMRDGDSDKEANFAVLRPTKCPSCLIEGEFIHTNHGAELISKAENREKMAKAVANGVLKFLGVTYSDDKELSPSPGVGSKEAIKKHLEAIEWQVAKIREDLSNVS